MQSPVKANRKPLILMVGLAVAVFGMTHSAAAFLINEWEPLDLEDKLPRLPQHIKPGENWRDPISAVNMVWITDGCYKMGSPPKIEGRETDEGPLYQTCVSGFWLGETEVTQEQWRRVMHNNPAQFRKGDDYPVENVSWEDVSDFLTHLNQQSQLNIQFRLPTEAEWEFACRDGGQRMQFPGSTEPSGIAWYASNSGQSTQKIGTRLPNRLGLKDMSGNVWEWSQDRYLSSYNPSDNATQPQHDTTQYYTIRGGSWQDDASTLRCSNRGFQAITARHPNLGLRLAASLKTKTKKPPIRPIDIKNMPF